MFTVKGEIEGRSAEVTWDAGELSGDREATWTAECEAEAREGMAVGPVCGPYTLTAHLSNALSAAVILRRLLGDDAKFSGDVPEPPAVPEGAVV